MQANFTSEILSCESDVHGFIECLKSKVEACVSSKHNELQRDLMNYFDKSANRDVIEQWRNRFTMQLRNTCDDEKNRIVLEMHKNGKVRLKQLENIKSVGDLFQKLLVIVKTKAYDLKLNHRHTLIKTELVKHFNGNLNSWISTFNPESAEVISSEDIVRAMNAELSGRFYQHQQLLQTELSYRDSIHLDDFSFDNYFKFFRLSTSDKVINWFQQTFNLKMNDTDKRCMSIVQRHRQSLVDTIRQYVSNLSMVMDFQPDYAAQIVQITKEFFEHMNKKLDKSNLVLSHQLEIRYTVYFSMCAANEFIKIKKSYVEKTDRSVHLRTYEPLLLETFVNAYGEISIHKDANRTAATVFAKILTGWINDTVNKKLGQRIANLVISKSYEMFSSKHLFFKQILIDLGESRNLQNYMEFLHNREAFLMEKISGYVNFIMQMRKNNKTNLQSLIEEEVKKHAHAVSAYIESIEREYFTNLEDYLNALRDRLRHTMYCTVNDITIIRCLHITDVKLFSKKTKELVNRTASEMIESIIATCQHSYSLPGFDNPIDLLSRESVGLYQSVPLLLCPVLYINEESYTRSYRIRTLSGWFGVNAQL